MAIAVAALLPIALVMFLIFTVGGNLADKDSLLSDLKTEQESLERRLEIGKWAEARQAIYRAESLPSNTDDSIAQYQFWLDSLARDTVKLDNVKITHGNISARLLERKETVFKTIPFTLEGVGTPRQVTSFLYHLNQAKILHRLVELKLSPQVSGGAARRTRTGLLDISMTIEVANLLDAPETRDFSQEFRDDMTRTLDQYHHIVTRRNLFGPPNSAPAPKTASRAKTVYEPGESISVALQIDDGDDKDQRYTWKLVDSPNEAAELIVDDGGAEARFTAPPMELGTHQFNIRVTDDGWPPKSGELSLTIRVEEPEPEEPQREPPKHARDTYVGGQTSHNGIRKIYIQIRREGRTERLVEGESFELDGMTWTIEKIEDEQVTISVDGERRVYKMRSSLADPERTDTTAAVSDR